MILLENFDNKLAEFLSGKVYPHNDVQYFNFWAVFMSFVSTISLIGSLAIYVKKCLSDRANQNMVQEIHIALEDQNQIEPEQPIQNNFNNCIHNKPMLNSYEILIIYPIAITGIIVMMFNPQFSSRRDTKFHPNMTFLYVEIMMNYIVGMIIPIYVLIKKRTIRNHIWDLIQDMLCNCVN